MAEVRLLQVGSAIDDFFADIHYPLTGQSTLSCRQMVFYNLFACGPGRFTDSNYLAGAYIFNTTWGLITVASSKSGSMLNFQDFTHPLGQGKSMGIAFRRWFDSQAPFEQWEREWYYGMVVCGDPTLRVVR